MAFWPRQLDWRCVLCLSLGAAVMMAAPLAGQSTEVRVAVHLRQAVKVEDRRVTVGRVATVLGGDSRLRKQVADLDIAELTLARAALSISQEQISYRIQLAGIEARHFHVEGAEATEVMLIRRQVREEDIVEAAKQAVLKRAPWKSGEAVLRLAYPPRFSALTVDPADRVELTAETSAAAFLAGPIRTDVTVEVNGERRCHVPVSLEAKLIQEVAVAIRNIELGESLTRSNLAVERRTIDAGTVLPSYAECLTGKKATRVIPPGHVLTSADVESLIPENTVLIKARDSVRIVIRVGNVRISATGEALQDGQLGQRIRARNVDSNNTVIGRVVDRALIEVDY